MIRHLAMIGIMLPTAGLAAFDSAKAYHLEIQDTDRIQAELSVSVAGPQLHAREWVLVATVPPEHPGQANPQISMLIDGKGVNPSFDSEQSGLKRPIVMKRVAVAEGMSDQRIDCRILYETQLKSRRLVEGPPASPVETLDETLRSYCLQAVDHMDWSQEVFQTWMKNNGLIRNKDERDLAFAYRVFHSIVKDAKYEFPTGDRRVEITCLHKKTDCGGFALLFCAVLRANGIPARTLFGRWAMSEVNDYKQWHVKSEFYADGIGWVPVELAGAVAWKGVKPDDCFGRDQGNFLILHFDPDLVINTIHFGTTKLDWMQSLCYWAKGGGTFGGSTTTEHWIVKKIDAANPAR